MQDFTRQEKPDISKYVPLFTLKDSTIKNILKVESDEHDKERLELQDLFRQFFISSATWGLEKWEKLFSVTPDNNDTIPQRRARIYAKLQGRQISTIPFLERLCKLFMSDGSIVKIIEHNEKYMFDILQENGSILYYNDMIEAVDTYKPAHLAFRVILKRLLELKESEKVNVGFVNAIIKESYIELAKVEDSKADLKTAVAIGRGAFVHMGLEKPKSANAKAYFGVYKKRVGKVIINPLDTPTPPPFKPVPNSEIGFTFGVAKSRVGTVRIEPFDPFKIPRKGTLIYNGLATGKGGKVTIDLEHVPKFDSSAYFGTINNKGGIIKIGGSK